MSSSRSSACGARALVGEHDHVRLLRGDDLAQRGEVLAIEAGRRAARRWGRRRRRSRTAACAGRWHAAVDVGHRGRADHQHAPRRGPLEHGVPCARRQEDAQCDREERGEREVDPGRYGVDRGDAHEARRRAHGGGHPGPERERRARGGHPAGRPARSRPRAVTASEPGAARAGAGGGDHAHREPHDRSRARRPRSHRRAPGERRPPAARARGRASRFAPPSTSRRASCRGASP